MAAESYRYALLGVVGLVALVAIFTIIKTAGSSFTLSDDNILGMAENPGSDPEPAAGGLPTQSTSSPSYACGKRASQPYFCNGDRACCGGSCVELPTCEGKENGLIFTCGTRPMYCCNDKLSLKACEPSCNSRMDCPTLNCIQAPCPQYECINSVCQMTSSDDVVSKGDE